MTMDATEEELELGKIVIEENIPMRERYPRNSFARIAEKMKIGDSIYTEDSRVIHGITSAINKKGGSVATRREGDNGRRIWRTT